MSGTLDQIKEERAKFERELMALVEKYRPVIGPAVDPLDNMACDHKYDEVCDCHVPENAMMVEWFVITLWSAMDGSGDSWSSAVSAPHMLASHRVGLLTTHLKEM